MGTFRYPIVLYSWDGSRKHRVEALVDTGATHAWVPRPTLDLEELGYKPSFERRLRLADGKVIERDGGLSLGSWSQLGREGENLP